MISLMRKQFDRSFRSFFFRSIIMSKSSDNPNEFREQGNQEFKQGHFQKAIEHYSDALKLLNELSLSDTIKTDLTKCYSNRAQCYINLEQYEDAIEDTTRGTDIRNRYRFI